MRPETAKGFKDYALHDQARREHIITTIRDAFQRYGYHPMETPILEKWDILAAKHAGGAEILKETYRLTDQGDRDLGMRYDMTVPLARYIAEHPTIKLPFKRYQIGPVFRDGPVKHGRLRQFYQADADIIGTDALRADAELLQLALDVFDQLDIDITIKINHRAFLDDIAAEADIDNVEGAILSLDKLEKIGEDGVIDDAEQRGIDADKMELMLTLVDEDFDHLEGDGVDALQTIFDIVDDERVQFTPSLARGLAYYTGTVFEAFTEGFDSSLAAGGRYDDMIGEFARNDFPAVGLSFGIEPIYELLDMDETSHTTALVVPIGIDDYAYDLVDYLRSNGVNTDVDLTGRGVSKNLDYANHYNIPYCILVGSQEQEQDKYTVKDMDTGEETMLTQDDVLKRLT